jgi:hypothetical protein
MVSNSAFSLRQKNILVVPVMISKNPKEGIGILDKGFVCEDARLIHNVGHNLPSWIKLSEL